MFLLVCRTDCLSYPESFNTQKRLLYLCNFNLIDEFDVYTNTMQINITCLIRIRLFEATELKVFTIIYTVCSFN